MEKRILEVKNIFDDSNLSNSERLLRSFYRTIEPHKKRNWKNPRRISWEIFAEKGRIGFYIVCPKDIERLVNSRIRDAYPSSEVRVIEEDYTDKFEKPFTTEMNLRKHHMFATRMETGDTPLNSVLNSMSRLEDDERMLLQVTMLPINDTWQGKAYKKYRDMLFDGKKPKVQKRGLLTGVIYSVGGLFRVIEYILSEFIPMTDDTNKNTPIEKAELKGTQKKIALPAFNTNIRMAVESKDKHVASTRLSELANSFIELDADNEWRRVKATDKKTMKFIRERKIDKHTNNIITTKELSPIIRLNNKHVIVPELKNAMKTLPIPSGLDEGIFFGFGMHNSTEQEIRVNPKRTEDFVHPVIYTGGVGGGKTTEIMNNMLGRAMEGYSTIFLDTQGDVSKDFLSQLPESEHDRVVWLNFGDLEHPVPIDLMEFVSLGNDSQRVDEAFVKDIAKNELVSIFKKMWGQNFGPQTEYITRNNITAVIETGGTMMEMFRMLMDDEYRTEVTMQLRSKAPFAFSFWANFQQNFSFAQKNRMLMPSINKIGSFVESPMIRNIMCQGSQNYNFREMMDTGKIVVVTIPKGVLIGSWQLIASLILSKIWLASLSRVSVPMDKRVPCFLASDEADDIINDQFPIMLSQSRKFRLGIHLGFQYLDQIKDNNKRVYNALIGNSPNMVALKIGEKDLDVYADIFKDYYKKEELRGFPNLHGVARLSINGQPTTPFTLRIPSNFHKKDNTWRVINEEAIEKLQAKSRKLYARPLEEVERIVDERYSEAVSNFVLDEEMGTEEEQIEASDELLNMLRTL